MIKTRGLTVKNSVPSAPSCGPLTLASTIVGGGQTTVITGQGILATNTAGTSANNTITQGAESITSNTAILHFEAYFDSIITAGTFGIGFSQTSPFLPVSFPFSAVQCNPVTSDVFDPLSASSIGTSAMASGSYRIALDLNMATGIAAFKDNQGTTGNLAMMGFNNANPVYLLAACNSGNGIGNSAGITLNAEGSLSNPFLLPTLGSIPYCQG